MQKPEMLRFKGVLLLALFVFILAGCTDKGVKYYKAGMAHYEAREYEFAAENLRQGLEYGAPEAKSHFHIAEAYRLSNRMELAEKHYQMAIDKGIKDEHAHFYYALALKANGKYESEKVQLKKYLKLGTNFGYIKRAKHELKNLEELGDIALHKKFFKIKNCKVINTEYIDYAPMLYNDRILYFTSSRGEGPIYAGQGTRYTDIFEYRFDGESEFSGIYYPLGEEINQPRTHEASATFSADGSTMIFARSGSGKKNDPTHEVDLFETKLVDGVWQEPVRLDISESNSWDSNPFLSPDGKYLYFSSNREGGLGGNDLWRASKDTNGLWHNPKNLGPKVNTEGNEQFPFKSKKGELYFSSDGHPSFGGLDLFVYRRQADGKTAVRNLGLPVNSSADDFGITFISDSSGYLASNRVGGLGDDDIYYFGYHHGIDFYLEGEVVGLELNENHKPNGNEHPLPHSQVMMSDEEGVVILQAETDSIGQFKVHIEPEHFYHIKAKHDGYITKDEDYSTIGKSLSKKRQQDLEQDIVYKIKIPLMPVLEDLVIEFPPILYPRNSWEITPEASVILDQMAEVIIDNPKILVELGSHTDARSSEEYNKTLSQKRAESAVNYILSKGVAQDRIAAVGYGESTPLKLKDDKYGISAGTVLTEDYINSISDPEQIERAHQLNRRTEFKIVGFQKDELQKQEDEERAILDSLHQGIDD